VLPLAEQDALELFCTRAAVDRSEQARELCRRLDNMPLALELAAARATVLTVEQILDRLSQRLDLFKGGRGADPRQETLRATIEWSYSLLGADDQQLFAALSIFPGGCTLEAVEEVCDADLDTLQSLVDKSLLRRTDDRFWMLETIADFAGQQLTRQSARTAGLLRRRQADWQLDWAANVDHRRKTQTEAFRLLLDELPNIRAARASLAADDRVCDELRLATLLASGLFQVGLVDESKEWLELALARSNPCPSSVRAEALMALSMQTSLAGDPDLGARYAGDADTAARDADDLRLRIDIAMAAGVARLGLGELEEAELLMAEALVGADEIGDVHRACELRNNLSYVALLTGDLEAARSLAEAGLDEARRHGDNAIAAALLHNLFLISMKSRREELALEYLREGLDFSSRHALMTIRALFLEGVAWVAARRDVPELAASLLGSSAKLAPDVGEAERDLRRDAERRARESLGDHEFEASSEAGKRLTIEEATELAENWLGEAACAPTQPTGLV
jgi:non-specific serine/threonine protein kinase